MAGHDGFDVRTCDNILIEDCEFYSGDDCIAGFDNCDVVIRNCILNTACSSMRFGGNHVLVENCRAFTPARYGFRGSLSKEQRAARAAVHEGCRHSTHTPFKYYCDFRAQIRKTPGDILIRNCTFDGPDAAFTLEFDGAHKWCCNRSLSSITFENCTITNVSKPLLIHGDANEPIDFTLKNVKITARTGFETTTFMDATNFSHIKLENVQLEGYHCPTIQAHTAGQITLTDTTDITIVDND
jgi:polygalacturonase